MGAERLYLSGAWILAGESRGRWQTDAKRAKPGFDRPSIDRPVTLNQFGDEWTQHGTGETLPSCRVYVGFTSCPLMTR